MKIYTNICFYIKLVDNSNLTSLFSGTQSQSKNVSFTYEAPKAPKKPAPTQPEPTPAAQQTTISSTPQQQQPQQQPQQQQQQQQPQQQQDPQAPQYIFTNKAECHF